MLSQYVLKQWLIVYAAALFGKLTHKIHSVAELQMVELLCQRNSVSDNKGSSSVRILQWRIKQNNMAYVGCKSEKGSYFFELEIIP